jgi:hypothetical protein
MTRTLLAIACLVAPIVGCARHYVVERDAGRVDGERSIMTRSDQQWSVKSAPAGTSGDESRADR